MTNAPLPYLIKNGTATQLIVDGAPFLIRGGELGNSSAERAYLTEFWPRLDALNLNALVAPVYWDVIEPVEGQFDWTTVDELLADARLHKLRIVLLWFGSWKNSMSSYVPGWVKKDLTRFPRARGGNGVPLEMLSAFYPSNWQADAKAFAALLAHLREVDTDHTVILVQVENEIGMIPDARDHAEAADQAWAGPVPAELLEYLGAQQGVIGAPLRGVQDLWASNGRRTAGTWAEVFGDSPAAQEIFQAYAFAKYCDVIAMAGRSELDLPMYTNAALIRTGTVPGQYPSAGPLPHLADIWRAGAPHLDFIAPDIYFPEFAHWADAYVESGNPLFVPEALRNVDAAANALYAYGKYGALGFSPFGIESMDGNAAQMYAGANKVIAQLTPLLAAHAGDGTMTGLLKPTADQRAPHRVRLVDVDLEATYERAPAPSLADGVINESGQAGGAEMLPAAAIVIRTGPDELVVAGIGVTLTFHDTDPSGEIVGILSCEEGEFDADGHWRHIRWLNGDQTHQGRHVRLEPGRFAIQRVHLYRYH